MASALGTANRARSLHPGWTWRRVTPNGLAHLCPPQRLSGSRSVCGRIPVPPGVTLWIPGEAHYPRLVPSATWCCKGCLRSEGIGA